MTHEEMVSKVLDWFDKADSGLQEQFRDCKESALIEYHHSLGREIRNKFGMWEKPWDRNIVGGIDVSYSHPDVVSM